MRCLFAAIATVAALHVAVAHAKGGGVGLWMEGQVSEVRAEGQDIRLVLNGRFWFEQHRGQQPSIVEITDRHGGPATIPAALTQGRPFYSMTADWGGGALRKAGAVLAILQAAAATGRVVRLELAAARLDFGAGGVLAIERAVVRRATDQALR